MKIYKLSIKYQKKGGVRMTISFIRVDDRIIHGQIIIRWSKEYPCDRIIAVNDKAAKNKIIKQALSSASEKRTYIWTYDEFIEKMDKVVESNKNYFLITKDPETMAKLLVDNKLKVLPNELNVGPQSANEETITINKNADISKKDIQSYEKIYNEGYDISFQLVPDSSKVEWKNVRGKILKL